MAGDLKKQEAGRQPEKRLVVPRWESRLDGARKRDEEMRVKLADKIKYLREVEGELRGLGRAMTQQELLKAIAAETESKLSQSYLSQIESGTRPHLTNTTRLLLAGFFKVHPGYLVDDPEGYQAELMSDARQLEAKLDLWLISGAERFRKDPELCRALLTMARQEDTRRCVLLLEAILETPELVDRLMKALRPEVNERGEVVQAKQEKKSAKRVAQKRTR